MKCPRCNVILVKEAVKDVNLVVDVDKCPNCKGMWFEVGELSKLDKIVEPKIIEFRKIPKEKYQLKALFCPSCADHPLMQKADHPRDSKVIIDYCEQCKGIWLDKGELEAIQQESWIITMGRLGKWIIGND